MQQTYTALEAAAETGINYRTLHQWVSWGLLRPSFDTGAERKKNLRFGAKDLREASILSALRRAGFSLQSLRQSIDYLRQLGHNPLSTGDFIWVRGNNGKPADLIKVCTTGEAIDIMQRHRGQFVMPLWNPPADVVEELGEL